MPSKIHEDSRALQTGYGATRVRCADRYCPPGLHRNSVLSVFRRL